MEDVEQQNNNINLKDNLNLSSSTHIAKFTLTFNEIFTFQSKNDVY